MKSLDMLPKADIKLWRIFRDANNREWTVFLSYARCSRSNVSFIILGSVQFADSAFVSGWRAVALHSYRLRRICRETGQTRCRSIRSVPASSNVPSFLFVFAWISWPRFSSLVEILRSLLLFLSARQRWNEKENISRVSWFSWYSSRNEAPCICFHTAEFMDIRRNQLAVSSKKYF